MDWTQPRPLQLSFCNGPPPSRNARSAKPVGPRRLDAWRSRRPSECCARCSRISLKGREQWRKHDTGSPSVPAEHGWPWGFHAVLQRATKGLQHVGNLYCASCYGQAARIAGCALAVIAMYAPEDGAQLVRIVAGDGGNRSLPPTGRQANAPGIRPKAFRIRPAFRSGSGRCQALTRGFKLAIRSCRRLIRFTNGERAAQDETPGPGEPNVSTLDGLCRSISGVALA